MQIREVVIISGKGGTGKTSLTAAFASITQNTVLCDADVDAADLHLLLTPHIKKRTDFLGGGIAQINPQKCTECGKCLTLCRFGAIHFDTASSEYHVDAIGCEGCGVCFDLCPENAIDFPTSISGEWYISETRYGAMVHARLGIAEENSGKLVSLIRKEAANLAENNGADLILTDGPPGVGCPVIASIGGATLLLIITEPTVSGIHDMERALKLSRHFRVPALICINKYDLNPHQSHAIERIAEAKNVRVVGKIPFNPIFTESMVHGKTISEYSKSSEVNVVIRKIWDKIMATPEMNLNP